jgi:hypothetical protein
VEVAALPHHLASRDLSQSQDPIFRCENDVMMEEGWVFNRWIIVKRTLLLLAAALGRLLLDRPIICPSL